MTPEHRRLIQQKITVIEQELQDLKHLLQQDSTADAVPDEDYCDVEIIEDASEQHREPKELLLQLFQRMLSTQNTEKRQSLIKELLHSSISDHSPAIASFFRFSFATFSQRWQEYLQKPSDPTSFIIDREVQIQNAELAECKFYLHSSQRSPSPISFKRDPKQRLEWKISSISL